MHTDQGYINFQEDSSEIGQNKNKYEEEEKKEENFAPVEIILALAEITLALVEIILALVDIIIVYSLLVDNSSSTQKAADSRNSRL